MKRPSGTKEPPSLHDLTFFTDRDLGKTVPRILREQGLNVEWYFDHFAEGQHVEDNRWLRFAAQKGWVALSHDDNIRRDTEAIRTIMEYSGRLFIIRGAVPGRELASIFLEARASVAKILGLGLSKGFIANVRRSTVQGGIVRSAAHLMLTYGDWKAGRRLLDDGEA